MIRVIALLERPFEETATVLARLSSLTGVSTELDIRAG
jgi:hypothetical protein